MIKRQFSSQLSKIFHQQIKIHFNESKVLDFIVHSLLIERSKMNTPKDNRADTKDLEDKEKGAINIKLPISNQIA